MSAEPSGSRFSRSRSPKVLDWPKKHPIAAAWVAVWGTAFSLSLFIPVVREICSRNEYTNSPNCAQHHFGPWIALLALEFIDGHSGFVTALGTLAVAAFTWTLWQTSDRQALLIRESIDEAKLSSQRELRAYVSVRKARIRSVLVGEKPVASMRLQNVGKTPAYDFTVQLSIGLLIDPAPESEFVNIPKTGMESKSTFAPGQLINMAVSTKTDLTSQDITDLANGKCSLYVNCAVNFRDAFGEQRHKHIRLLYSHRLYGVSSNRLETCGDGNEEN